MPLRGADLSCNFTTEQAEAVRLAAAMTAGQAGFHPARRTKGGADRPFLCIHTA